jgi:hypothetical protein
MKGLPDNFYRIKDYSETMSRKDLKELLLNTDGKAIIRGFLHEIKSKHIAAGVYRVWTKREGD